MSPTFVWCAGAAVVAAAATCLYVALRRRARRRATETCRRMRERSLEVGARAEFLAELAGRMASETAERAAWEAIRMQQMWLAENLPDLRNQLRHYGLRRATAELAEALTLLNVELRRRRSLSIAPAALVIDRNPVVSARFRERADELLLAARFLSIVARVDECRALDRCNCASDRQRSAAAG